MKWTKVSDGLPSVPDIRMGGSDDVLCQDGNGNTFIGYVRRDLDVPYWTQNGRDNRYSLEGIVRWISLSEVVGHIER